MRSLALGVVLLLSVAAVAEGQPIGTFRWQVQPYCNVITVALTQNGGVFRLEGTDDRCGAGGTAASVIGTAFFNANGTIGLGFNIAGPAGEATQIDATVTLPSANGTWRDTAGHSGAFVLTPGGGTGGAPRPAAGPVGAASVDAAQVQLRVTGACPAGQYMQSVEQGGAVTCAAVAGSAGGTITGVAAGTGLTGGGTSGAVTVGLATTSSGAVAFNNPNGLVAAGLEGAGGTAPSGPGTRMMWNPRKAAFRAGTIDAVQWDDGNVGLYSTAFGSDTIASNHSSTAFGDKSEATGRSAVAGGHFSRATELSAVALGDVARADGYAAIALGANVTAGANGSVALGSYASTTSAAYGSVVFGDMSTSTRLTSSIPGQFLVRASGGIVFYTSADTRYGIGPGVVLFSGGSSWSASSDANLKTRVRELPGEEVLAKIASMPVSEWGYKAQDASIRHIGPMAQDFHAAFGLGEDPLRINSIDADGVALAAVRALEARTRALGDANRTLREENAALRARLDRLEAALVRQ